MSWCHIQYYYMYLAPVLAILSFSGIYNCFCSAIIQIGPHSLDRKKVISAFKLKKRNWVAFMVVNIAELELKRKWWIIACMYGAWKPKYYNGMSQVQLMLYTMKFLQNTCRRWKDMKESRKRCRFCQCWCVKLKHWIEITAVPFRFYVCWIHLRS